MKNWSDIDFGTLVWEDCDLYSISLPILENGNKFCLDINYIDDNNQFDNIGGPMIIPAIIIFEDVTNLKIKIDYLNMLNLQIFEIKRSDLIKSKVEDYFTRDYKISFLNNGEISFNASRFSQYSICKDEIERENPQSRGLINYFLK